MTLARTIADFVVDAQVPPEVRAASEAPVIDCLGCILSGARTETVQAILGLIEEPSGSSSLLGQGRRAGPRSAALLNGTSGHALDFDDINWNLYGHPSTVLVPALVAVAEAQGKVSGKRFLDAYAIGVEVSARIGGWINPDLYLRGWHATAALGVLGAAAAVARLSGLDRDKTINALAIAASQASGLRENFGSMVKPLHAGRAAEAAVLSVQLAQAGFTGSERALDGRFGYFAVLTDKQAPDCAALADVLGAPWDILESGIALKRYPSCGATHCALDALLDMREAMGFSIGDVAEIRCGAEPLALKVLQYPRPRTGLEGKFSMQFCLAVAAADGAPRLKHFTREWTESAAIVDLLPRIAVVDRDDLAGARNDAVPAHVEVILRNGQRAERTVRIPVGDTRRPMSEVERRAKFLDCSVPVLGDAASDAWDALATFRQAEDIAPLIARLNAVATTRETSHA